ncbi:hypothetical protein L905_06845 [Agrobacterium sp. TS43]|nr:hypothetical protein L902_01690 [Agrobacterium radiobacter DSM 30147]KVK49865.1 hypothetical protein L903_18500 [Agrobacterium sp. JL28]KVK50157.1 hypothetical protein L904_18500 [Agrobacterium sp. LY4]KVK59199.1 hypothetical protein L905_06845 [Agrobacterium sp. TS43]KVK62914.1 hypothetical protein L906_17635 [Agrobacterium sp. TS45]KVK67436.1 hypothetical protein L907_17595 [Agrobacterium sp. C13]
MVVTKKFVRHTADLIKDFGTGDQHTIRRRLWKLRFTLLIGRPVQDS